MLKLVTTTVLPVLVPVPPVVLCNVKLLEPKFKIIWSSLESVDVTV